MKRPVAAGALGLMLGACLLNQAMQFQDAKLGVFAETALFSNVSLQRGAEQKSSPIRRSNVSVYDLKSKSVDVIYSADQMIEAPTYSPDGKYVLVNSKGDLWKLAVGSGNSTLEKVPLGSISRCNNDKGVSPDGKLIAFSSSATGHGSQVYTVSSRGGTPSMVVAETPSYFHAFSPDGRWLAIVAEPEQELRSISATCGRRATAATDFSCRLR